MKYFVILSLFFNFNINANELRDLLAYEKNTIDVFQKSVRSVVNISQIRERKIKSLFNIEKKETPVGTGSGFVWDERGHIVTNYHVVHGAEKFMVKFHEDSKEYRAKLIGKEPRKDIAVLKLEKIPDHLYKVSLATSKDLKVGQKAIAIGNPFGLSHTMTQGVVSALGRDIKGVAGVDIKNMIQTDSSINPGNSGGPLYNSLGKVIGMNTMIMSGSGTSSGVGFAVPSDTINRIVPQLIEYGKVKQPGLGIVSLEEQYKRYFNIKKGLIIKEVLENSSAEAVGLKGI